MAGSCFDEPIIYPLPHCHPPSHRSASGITRLSEEANGLSRSDRFWRRHEGVAGTIEAGRKLISSVDE